jgi:membrane-bound lytic murein transglycosylase F
MKAFSAAAIGAVILGATIVTARIVAEGTSPPGGQPTALQGFRALAQAREAARITSRYDDVFSKYTRRFFGPMFDWRWFKAQAYAESAINQKEVSWVGARGIMQLMPTTFREIQSELPDVGPIDDPQWNIAAGIFYNSKLWNWWHFIPAGERYPFMFGSYNAGTGNILHAFNAATARYGDSTWAGITKVAPTIPHWRYTETLAYVQHIDTTFFWLTNPFTFSLHPPAPPPELTTPTSSIDPALLDGPFDRRAPRREHLRSVLGDVEAVLQPNTELAVDRDRRLVAEAHARLNLRRVAFDEIRPLVPVEPDAVPGSMRQARHLVAGSESGVGDHLPRRGIH